METSTRAVLSTAVAPVAWGSTYYVTAHYLPSERLVQLVGMLLVFAGITAGQPSVQRLLTARRGRRCPSSPTVPEQRPVDEAGATCSG
jgi:hypothetical protein